MDVKQGPFGPYEDVIKSEPDVSSQIEGNYCTYTNQQMFNNDHDSCLFDDKDDIFCEHQTTEQSPTRNSLNVGEIKQEIIECEESKIEYRPCDLPTKVEHDSVCEKEQLVSTTVKKELNIHDVVDVSEVIAKQEVTENIQAKTESELLTSYCDLPTLKCESAEYSDNLVQPCSSKHAERTLKTLKTKANVSKKKRRRYPCAVCQKDFPSSKSRSKHIDGHFGNNFVVCEFCGKLMAKIELIRHYFIHVVKNRTRKVYMLINHVSSVQHHLITQSEEKQLKCDICSTTFTLKSNLQRHLKVIHSDEKPFKCNFCSKEFKDKYNFKGHIILHTNQKRFKCDICFKEFKHERSVSRHLKIIHSDEKTFKCDFCSKKFYLKTNLHQHLIVHTNKQSLQSFECDICSKEFKLKGNLRQHLKIIHSDEKPFKCDICSKKFNVKSNLHRHLIVHTDKKLFKCDICSTEFKHKRNLRQHLKRIHCDLKLFV